MNPRNQSFVVTFLLIVAAVAMIVMAFQRDSGSKGPLTINEIARDIKAGKVARVLVQSNGGLRVIYTDGNTKGVQSYKETDTTLVDQLLALGVTPDELSSDHVKIEVKAPSRWAGIATGTFYILPVLIMAFVLWLIFRQAQSNNNSALSFGKSKARVFSGEHPTVTFQDVAGIDEGKRELAEVVEFLKQPQKFIQLGARIPKGILLVGPPGTGKTLLAKAVSGEAGVPFFSLSGSEFIEMFVGVGASRVRDLFEQAKRHSPCLVFIDELDAVGRRRGAVLFSGSNTEAEQTLNQLLVEMDGFDTDTNVIVLAATNRPDVLDPALLRPGRFDRRVTLSRPDTKGREAILKIHVKGKPLEPSVDLSAIAHDTPGFVGSDLENLVNESAMLAARRNKKAIGQAELEESIQRVAMGPDGKSLLISDVSGRNNSPAMDSIEPSSENKKAEIISISFSDVGGLLNAKRVLEPIVKWLKNPDGNLGSKVPRGVLITGPSGSGKTLLARALAGEANTPLFSYNGSEFAELLVGMGSHRMRNAFTEARRIAKEKKPCIIFLDQIDLIGMERSANMGVNFGAESEMYKTLGQLLAELDNLRDNNRIFVVAATSRSRVLDPALSTPGRLSLRLDLKLPDEREREEILSIHMREIPSTPDVNVHVLAENTTDFSGAELQQLVHQACLFARERIQQTELADPSSPSQSDMPVSMIDFECAKGLMLPHPRQDSPVKIVEHFDKYVTAQATAKKRLAVAVSNHYLRLEEARGFSGRHSTVKKSNVLMMGPTGSGKTLLVETIASYLEVPYVIFNSTVLTETGYAGATVEQILYRLMVEADLNLRKAEYGIICIDEFDKLAFHQGEKTRHTGPGVQQELLKIIEGTVVDVPKGGGQRRVDQSEYYQFNTQNILFVCLGAFVNIDSVIEHRLAESMKNTRNKTEILKFVQPEDVINYGFLPELIGRFPIITFTESLTKDDLVLILKNPHNGLVTEYTTLLEWQGWQQPGFDESAIELIASEALRRKVGARGLRGIMEEVLLEKMYARPRSDNLENAPGDVNGDSNVRDTGSLADNQERNQFLTINDEWIKQVFSIDNVSINRLLKMPLRDAVEGIKLSLDECMAGNPLAKTTLAVTSFSHYAHTVGTSDLDSIVPKDITSSDSAEKTIVSRKEMVLLVDPYTEQANKLAQTLAQIWNVPYASMDAEYLERNLNMRTGQTLAWMMEPAYSLLKQVNYNLQRAQQGVLFINGFDRVTSKISVNASYVNLTQQLENLTKGQKLFLQAGNGYEFEFRTDGLFIILAGNFLSTEKRLKPSEPNAAKTSFYEPTNLLPYLMQEFNFTPDLVQSLIIVPMDSVVEELDLRRMVQDEAKHLMEKYKDLIAYTGIEVDLSALDYEQLLLETSGKNGKIAEIRTQLESKLIQQLYRS